MSTGFGDKSFITPGKASEFWWARRREAEATKALAVSMGLQSGETFTPPVEQPKQVSVSYLGEGPIGPVIRAFLGKR